MQTREIINNTYVYFYNNFREAQHLAESRNKLFKEDCSVIEVPSYGWLVRGEGRLYDAHGVIPKDVVTQSFLSYINIDTKMSFDANSGS